MPQSNLRLYGDNVYSYQTLIRQTLADGTTLGNVTRYTPTTITHQVIAACASCDITLDNVPVGCNDLYSLAVERGLLPKERDLIEEARDKEERLKLEY